MRLTQRLNPLWLTVLHGSLINGQDPPCNIDVDPECTIPWPPGHHGIGSSYWAVGFPGASMGQIQMTLTMPQKGSMTGSALALIPSLENSNISDSADTGERDEPSFANQWLVVDYGNRSICNQDPSQWCVAYGAFNGSEAVPVGGQPADGGPSYVQNPGDSTTFNCMCLSIPESNSQMGFTDAFAVGPSQSTARRSRQGAESSQIETSSTPAPFYLWLKTECQCDTTGTIPAHTYTDVIIKFDSQASETSPEITYKNSCGTAPYLDYSDPDNPAWRIDRVDIEESSCQEVGCPDGPPRFGALGSPPTRQRPRIRGRGWYGS